MILYRVYMCINKIGFENYAMTSEHIFLVYGLNPETAKSQVVNFLKGYQLVKYDRFELKSEDIIDIKHQRFWEVLEKGLQRNEEILKRFIEELKLEGYQSLDTLRTLPQGYLSKILHLIAHLLDGFFSIDSYFYNLVEDSHFLSPQLRTRMLKSRENFYLVPLVGFYEEKIYPFEMLSPRRFFKVQ